MFPAQPNQPQRNQQQPPKHKGRGNGDYMQLGKIIAGEGKETGKTKKNGASTTDPNRAGKTENHGKTTAQQGETEKDKDILGFESPESHAKGHTVEMQDPPTHTETQGSTGPPVDNPIIGASGDEQDQLYSPDFDTTKFNGNIEGSGEINPFTPDTPNTDSGDQSNPESKIGEETQGATQAKGYNNVHDQNTSDKGEDRYEDEDSCSEEINEDEYKRRVQTPTKDTKPKNTKTKKNRIEMENKTKSKKQNSDFDLYSNSDTNCSPDRIPENFGLLTKTSGIGPSHSSKTKTDDRDHQSITGSSPSKRTSALVDKTNYGVSEGDSPMKEQQSQKIAQLNSENVKLRTLLSQANASVQKLNRELSLIQIKNQPQGQLPHDGARLQDRITELEAECRKQEMEIKTLKGIIRNQGKALKTVEDVVETETNSKKLQEEARISKHYAKLNGEKVRNLEAQLKTSDKSRTLLQTRLKRLNDLLAPAMLQWPNLLRGEEAADIPEEAQHSAARSVAKMAAELDRLKAENSGLNEEILKLRGMAKPPVAGKKPSEVHYQNKARSLERQIAEMQEKMKTLELQLAGKAQLEMEQLQQQQQPPRPRITKPRRSVDISLNFKRGGSVGSDKPKPGGLKKSSSNGAGSQVGNIFGCKELPEIPKAPVEHDPTAEYEALQNNFGAEDNLDEAEHKQAAQQPKQHSQRSETDEGKTKSSLFIPSVKSSSSSSSSVSYSSESPRSPSPHENGGEE